MAGVITALVLMQRPDVLRLIWAVPVIGTGSPLTLIYFVCEGLVGLMLFLRARSSAINVAALPVSGKARKLKEPFACETLSIKRFTHMFGFGSASATALIGRFPCAVFGFPCLDQHILARCPAPPQWLHTTLFLKTRRSRWRCFPPQLEHHRPGAADFR